MKIKNLNNKQIIKINYLLKLKKTPGMINFAKQIELKFITQKRMLSTHSTDTEIFDFLNINVQNCLNNSKDNLYIQGYLKTLSTLNQKLHQILTDDTLTLTAKQKKLEKLSQKTQTFKTELTYNVPKSLSSLISKLDSYLFNSENLTSNNFDPYLPSVLAEELGNHDSLKNSYKTKALINTITTFKDILQIFQFTNNSFGLFLIYTLVSFLRADTNDTKLKKKVSQNEIFQRTIIFKYVEEIESSEDNVLNLTLNIKRVDFTDNFGRKLIETFTRLKNLALYQMRKTADVENVNNLDETQVSDEIYEILKTKNSNTAELFKLLTTKYKFIELEPIEVAQLGVYCISILEAINILTADGLVRDKKKTVSMISLGKKYAAEVFSIPSRPKSLPMVVKPNFWKKSRKSKKGNLNYGGYLFNKVLNYPAILNQHKKGVTVITETDLKNINYIQSNYYRVNESFLKYVESNFREIALLYLRKISNVEFFINNLHSNDNSNDLEIQSIQQLLFSDKELSRLLSKFDEGKINKTLKNQIINRKEFLIEQYQNVADIFFGLIHSYIIARNYKNYKFYFTVFMDNRGRIYFKSSGSSFGLQTGDFSKALLDLAGNSYFDHDIPNKIKYPATHSAYLDYKNSLDKQKEPFQFIRAENQILPTTIPNDASCSGTSILSGLSGFRTGLFLTNVVVLKKQDSETKQCIYNHFLDKLTQNFPVNALSLYTSEQVEKKAKTLNISENEFLTEINWGLQLIKTEFLKREHAKQFVMRKNYSETDKGRSHYIYEEIFKNVLITSSQFLGPNETKIYKSLCYYLATWIDSNYHETFPEISELCSLLTQQFENQNPINLSCPHQSDFQYQQLLYETKKIPRPSFQKKRNSDLSIHLRTDKADFKKTQRSIIANFIHYLDSRLNFLVIDKCRNDSILLWPNHDSFYTNPEKKHVLLKHYFDSFIELLLKEDVLTHFLKQNNIEPDIVLTNLLAKYSINRVNILNDLNTNNLEMSKFILTS
jgi:hypothetical protein